MGKPKKKHKKAKQLPLSKEEQLFRFLMFFLWFPHLSIFV